MYKSTDDRGKPICGRVCVPSGAENSLVVLPVRLVAEGRLHPEIGRVADWSDTARTLADVYERRVQGNAVPTIG